MNRFLLAAILAVVATGLVIFEQSPAGKPVRTFFAGLIAGEVAPKKPEKITVIETPQNPAGIHTLDAALILRAILRYEPKAIAFLSPLDADVDATLLVSRLEEAKMPVIFTSNSDLQSLPKLRIQRPLPALTAFVPKGFPLGGFAPARDGRVFFAGRLGADAVPSNVLKLWMAVRGLGPGDVSGSIPGVVRMGAASLPVDELGCIHLNPLVEGLVERISLGSLLLQTDRAERGLITPVLDAKFRGRIVAVQREQEETALGIGALQNDLVDRRTPEPVLLFGVLLAATLPFWKLGRVHRMLVAVMVTCAILLAAMGLYPINRMPIPLLVVVVLPLLALIPPGAARSLNKA